MAISAIIWLLPLLLFSLLPLFSLFTIILPLFSAFHYHYAIFVMIRHFHRLRHIIFSIVAPDAAIDGWLLIRMPFSLSPCRHYFMTLFSRHFHYHYFVIISLFHYFHTLAIILDTDIALMPLLVIS
jgi:hypothetical protein